MKKLTSLFLSILILCSFGGCNNIKIDKSSNKLSIVTTIFPYYDFARQIVADKADVTMLLSPGAESHDYEPSPQDIISINNADIFIYNGGESDEWVESILSSLDGKVNTLRMFDYVTLLCTEEEHSHEEEHHNEEHHHSEYDEHIWTSPANAVALANAIAQDIISVDAKNKEFYNKNLENYINELYNLDEEFFEVTNSAIENDKIITEKPVIVIADRFPMLYFTDRYGLEYKSLFPGCSADTQPSISTVTGLIDFVNDEKIPTVFHMDTTNEKYAQLISEDTDAVVQTLFSCHNVTKEQFEEGVTYLSLMELNLQALKEAF